MRRDKMRSGRSLLFILVFAFAAGLFWTYLPGDAFAQTRPAFVKETENPDRLEIFRASVTVELIHNEPANYQCFDPVPTGKRLIIEHVSVRAVVPAGQKPIANINVGGMLGHYLVLTPQGPNASGTLDVFGASQPVMLRLEQGTRACAYIGRDSGNDAGAALTYIVLTGYLVNYP